MLPNTNIPKPGDKPIPPHPHRNHPQDSNRVLVPQNRLRCRIRHYHLRHHEFYYAEPHLYLDWVDGDGVIWVLEDMLAEAAEAFEDASDGVALREILRDVGVES